MPIYNSKNSSEEMQSRTPKKSAGRGVVPLRWLGAAALATALTLGAAALLDRRLPTPLDRSAPPHRFIAQIAHEHLVNLTDIGPRVAGSYENEVAAVRVLLAAAKRLAAGASAHNRVDVDVFAASGAFALSFLDGMTNVYRDVQSVVVRVRGAGDAGRARSALLLNCHFDSVPDSPGASDDAAGCAVGLETLRALASGPPLPHPVLLLLNGAEENIMQASHAFITQHPWAKRVRAFVNVEACGAGGREVLFQAGPHDPWIVETYASEAPHPFASSLAQELFESGLIPADTDFRIFRDYGNLSGVDLAWSSNGYVYHTRLDTAAQVPLAALQRTGDNVLALVTGLLRSPRLLLPPERERAPLFFDVAGLFAVSMRARAAVLLLLAALLALAAELRLSAGDAARHLYMTKRAWARVVGRAALGALLSSLAGVAAALLPALLLHATGARLAFYARPWLLMLLYCAPALACAWADARHTWGSWLGRGAATVARGWWAWRAWRDAQALGAGVLAAAGAAVGLRSSFVPLLWTLPTLVALPLRALRPSHERSAALHAAGATLPAVLTSYLALNSMQMFVPIMGRAGTAPLPADVTMALVASSLTLMTFSWMLPLVVAAKDPKPLMAAALAACALGVVLAASGPAYSAERPQRLMVFHTRRTVHGPSPVTELFYWVPELDGNTARSVNALVGAAESTRAADCARWPLCGAPYFLPVHSLVARGYSAPADEPPLAAQAVSAALGPPDATHARTLTLNVTGPQHVVVVLAPAEGARVAHCEPLGAAPQEGPAWGARRTYFVALHDARPGRPHSWSLVCRVSWPGGRGMTAGRWLSVSAAGHAMAARRAPAHERLLRAFPAWTAPTGWGVDLHLLEL